MTDGSQALAADTVQPVSPTSASSQAGPGACDGASSDSSAPGPAPADKWLVMLPTLVQAALRQEGVDTDRTLHMRFSQVGGIVSWFGDRFAESTVACSL